MADPTAPTPATSGGYPRKRRQTRRRLVDAAMRVLAERGPNHVTAAQISAAAGVATGTFYNHFPTVDECIDAIAHDLSRGVEIGRDTLSEIEHDPATRVALGVLQLQAMADTAPTSAAAFVTLAALRPDFRARLRSLIEQAITDGVEAGTFDTGTGPAATNAVMGATLQSMRSRVLGETDGSEAEEVARLVLRLLGADPASVDSSLERAAAHSSDHVTVAPLHRVETNVEVSNGRETSTPSS